jgi:hypothetical protein
MIQRLLRIVAALHRLVQASGALIDDATPPPKVRAQHSGNNERNL